MLRRISIAKRVILVILLPLCAVALLAAVFIPTAIQIKDDGVAAAKQAMMEGEQEKIRLGAQDMAYTLGLALQGVADPAARAEIIKNHIGSLRFEKDKSGYFFVYRGTVVFVHPAQPALANTDMGQNKDVNGVYYISELFKAAQRGGGFVSYIFGKPQPNG
ncbi:MAG: cache domain-containing protein, partial [Betaproteobacteria bacterium]|nr:cache domain-containing protein [Betaproteobacteria bacterium]